MSVSTVKGKNLPVRMWIKVEVVPQLKQFMCVKG